MCIDFLGKEKALDALHSTWEDFRNDLKFKKFNYNDVSKAKKSNFLKALDGALNYGENKAFMTKDLRYLYTNSTLCRGAKIDVSEIKNISYSRFIPDQKKYPSINRFSPEGIDYLYLALRFGRNKFNKARFNFAEETCIKEIRAQRGDTVALCNFNILKTSFCKKVIDLTIAENKSFDELEDEFKEWFNNMNIQNIHNETSIHLLKIYFKMISEEIFKPLEGVEKQYEYAPFHCLAHYFSMLGFDGIIYKSTVYDRGRNIVLFNKYDAYGVGEIRIEQY